MKECVFCKIVKGEVPAEKIFEDENFLSFLDISPSTNGHTLIIPKKHYETIFDMPKELLKEMIGVTQKISLLLKKRLGAEGINLINSNKKVAQQDISHYHIHIIPRYSKDKFKIVFYNKTKSKELEKIAKKIRD